MSKPDQKPLNAWELLRDLKFLWSRERQGFASTSEKKRWLQKSAVIVNGERVSWDEPMDFPIFSMVLFPKGSRVTLL